MKTQLVSVIAAGLLIASSVTYAQSEDDTTQQVNDPTVTQNGDTLPDAQGGLSGMGGAANTDVPANNTLRVRTTNQGVDNITASQYANFDDVLFSASGFTFSLSNGELIATI